MIRSKPLSHYKKSGGIKSRNTHRNDDIYDIIENSYNTKIVKENIIYFDDINTNLSTEELGEHLLQYDGLLTSRGNSSVGYSNRYDCYSDRDVASAIFTGAIEFIKLLYDFVKDPIEKDKLGYVKNNSCPNLRVKSPVSLEDTFAKLESIAHESFYDRCIKTKTNISDEKEFRVLRKVDGPGNSRFPGYSVLIVVYVDIEDTAFKNEQYLAEDLYLYKKDSEKFHFNNFKDSFSRLGINYNEDSIHWLQEANTRLNPRTPFIDGYINFNEDKYQGIGRIISDVSVYDADSNPTYFSVKSFRESSDSMVNLATLTPNLDFANERQMRIGKTINYLAGREYDYYAKWYSNVEKDEGKIKEIVNELVKKYNEKAIEALGYVDKKTLSLYIEDYLKFPIFYCWGINPFYYLHGFMVYLRNIGKPISEFPDSNEDDDNNIYLFGLSSKGLVENKYSWKKTGRLNRLERFIKDSLGKGYILTAVKNRSVYFKDFRLNGIKDEDCEIYEYTIEYPNIYKKETILDIYTRSLHINGRISPTYSSWPNKLDFFYNYRNFEEYFGNPKYKLNDTMEVGKTIDEGFYIGSPVCDRI